MSYKVDREKLEEWIQNTFSSYKHYRNDFLINSIFTEDRKFKLSISVDKCCYHCWKTDESGPLWDLVCKVQSCSKEEALNLVYEIDSIAKFDSKINSLKKQIKELKFSEIKEKTCSLPIGFSLIKPELIGNINIKALQYCIKERKIDPIKWRMGYCNGGKYDKRLIVPFYDKEGKLIYWIARSLYNQEPKYLNPPVNDEEKDTKKEDVLFSETWNFEKKDVIIVEGALDAITLIELGFNAVSIQGKSISATQISLLRNSNIIFGFDRDEYGIKAIEWNYNILNQEGIFNVKYILPPLDNKKSDWNSSYISMGSLLKEYIKKNISPISFQSQIRNKLRNI